MLFSTVQFAVFFGAVLLTYRCVPQRYRNRVLLAASLVFYTLWLPIYLLLLLGDISVNYLLLRGMVRSRHPRVYLALSVVFTLGLLAGFKYAAMIISTALPALDAIWGYQPAVPEFFLPLGISFYSFQILSLTIDTYRGRIEPIRSFSRYTLFISFFPQLIAGPILRGSELLPQLEHGGAMNRERSRRGIWLIVIGVAKKVILADFLLSGFVNQVFDAQGVTSSPFNLIALYSFSFQIYYDFSGYTNIARGISLLLGFELPANFKEPYLARNFSEFWQRWHITLSRWLSDYLYIPLGGNRRGAGRTCVNLMVTMLLGGLWHGASWNFVIWGGLHGVVLVLYRIIRRTQTDLDAHTSRRDFLPILFQFHLVTLLWVFFRTETLTDATTFLSNLFVGGNKYGWPVIQTSIVILCVLLHGLERYMRRRLPQLRDYLSRSAVGPAMEGATGGALIGMALMVSGAGGDFIYFQF